MRRREFIALAGAAAAFPRVALAQTFDQVKRITTLWNVPAGDPSIATNSQIFETALRQRGWAIGTTVDLEERFDAGRTDVFVTYMREMATAPPDVIVAVSLPVVALAAQFTMTIPIIQMGGCAYWPILIGCSE